LQIALDAVVCLRPTLAATLAAVAEHGVHAVQFNLRGVPGHEALPAKLAPGLVEAVRRASVASGVCLAAVSGTYNMIDPDRGRRQEGARRLRQLIAVCPPLGVGIVSLCTGTRDPHSMWNPHPDNGTPQAWRDLLDSLAEVLPDAEAHGVTLAVEPEVSNVVDSAARARRLLDEVRSPRLKVCMDGANLFHVGELPRMATVLDEAFALLGTDVVLAHAKDLDHDGEAGHLPAGHGVLDYDRYLSLLRSAGFQGAIVLHGLAEHQVAGCATFLRDAMTRAGVEAHPHRPEG
jgi:sugar phosphate isomerase/epimerase